MLMRQNSIVQSIFGIWKSWFYPTRRHPLEGQSSKSLSLFERIRDNGIDFSLMPEKFA